MGNTPAPKMFAGPRPAGTLSQGVLNEAQAPPVISAPDFLPLTPEPTPTPTATIASATPIDQPTAQKPKKYAHPFGRFFGEDIY
jgi:hypothetical protein